jgi:hypothetical protein
MCIHKDKILKSVEVPCVELSTMSLLSGYVEAKPPFNLTIAMQITIVIFVKYVM